MMRITVTGDTDIINRVIGSLDFKVPADQAAGDIRTMILGNVARGVDPDGVPFAPHSPRYRRPGSPPPYAFLNWTGQMLGSFRHDVEGGNGGATATISNTSRLFGYHQEGTRFIPARRMFGTPSAFVAAVAKRVDAYLRSKL